MDAQDIPRTFRGGRASRLGRRGEREHRLGRRERQAQAVRQALCRVAARELAGGVRGLVRGVELALEDEHPREVVVEARARALHEPHDARRERELLLPERRERRVVRRDFGRDRRVLGVRRAAARVAEGVPDVLGRLLVNFLLDLCEGCAGGRDVIPCPSMCSFRAEMVVDRVAGQREGSQGTIRQAQ